MNLDPNYIAKLNKLSKLYKKFPDMAAIEAVNFSKERFVQKNWVDKSRTKWKSRQRKDRGSLMVRSGRLKRSIRKLKATRNSVIIGTDVPYAQAHNEGATIKKTVNVKQHTRKRKGRETETVKAHRRKMNLKLPERRFIGQSALLGRRIERLLQKEINDILKS
jgi:phage gpG-like protein